jgi:hypothetical protein
LRRIFRVSAFLVLLSGIFSCSPLKRLKDGEILLNKNIVKSDKAELNDGIRSIIKQKPNRRILGVFRFHLGVYTLFDKEGDSSKFRNWVKNTIGEKPVLLDTFLTKKSTTQIRQYMINSGYFNAVVWDETNYPKKKKANVIYHIQAGNPYFIGNYSFKTLDKGIEKLLLPDTVNSLIRPGILFDANVLQNERDRITNLLKNEGYYFFSQAYIRYDADTIPGSYRVELKMIISRINENNEDSILDIHASDHRQYHLNNIFIQTDFNPLSSIPNNPTDTVFYKDYTFVTKNGIQKFKMETIRHRLLFKKGDMYRLRNLENTYKLLGNLNVFKFVNIKFEPTLNDSTHEENLLDCYINLTPSAKQEHREEIEGTFNGGAVGVAGNIAYRNKNFLKGAELLEIKLKGALEYLQDFSDTTSSNTSKFLFFNTFELGPQVNLSFPKILAPKGILPKRLRYASPYSSEYTTLTADYDLQQRPEFKRTIAKFYIQWFFNGSETISHYIVPAEINFVNVLLNSAFKSKLDDLNDPYLDYTYADHLITAGHWTYIINTQRIKKLRNFYYFRLHVEFAGNTIWLFNHLLSSEQQPDGSYQVLNTRYAQYFRPDFDFRYYHVLNANNTLVYRLVTGIGIPYLNGFALPFEKAFYAGGANDLRAYRARSVGPGSYVNAQSFEQTGEIKINANAEFRFDIFKILQGATFVDAGNIWLIKDDPNRPGGQFKANKFINEFAIGGGLGARLNFTFFIIRLDAGVPIKNPALPIGDRWVISNPNLKTVTFNLAIGYPF